MQSRNLASDFPEMNATRPIKIAELIFMRSDSPLATESLKMGALAVEINPCHLYLACGVRQPARWQFIVVINYLTDTTESSHNRFEYLGIIIQSIDKVD